MKNTTIYSYDDVSAAINKLKNHNQYLSLSVKRKSEANFNQIDCNFQFLTLKIMHKNKKDLEKGVKFNREISNYQNHFWENETYSSLFLYLRNKFGANFLERKNIQSKQQ